jgi:hypothetical protein
LLTRFLDRSSGKATEIGGLHKNWKQRAQVLSQLRPGSSVSDHDDLDDVEPTDGGEIAANEAEESLEAVRKGKEAIGVAKKTHKDGTKGVGRV